MSRRRLARKPYEGCLDRPLGNRRSRLRRGRVERYSEALDRPVSAGGAKARERKLAEGLDFVPYRIP